MKTTIIYHQVRTGVDCPDGIVSAWIASQACADIPEIIGCCYQSEIPVFSEPTNIIIVDFSFKKDVINQWLKDGHTITVLDHHQTALDELKDFSSKLLGKILVNDATSGARLTWEHFFNYPEPDFIKYIVDRDNFNFVYPETQAIHEALAKLRSLCPDIETKFAFFNILINLDDDELTSWLVPIGDELLKEKKEAIIIAFSRWEEKLIDGILVPCIYLNKEEERLTSDICMIMYRDKSIIEKGYPFVACVNSDLITVSLRSDKNGNNFDVSEIAKKYGGGGHRNAAGFKIY